MTSQKTKSILLFKEIFDYKVVSKQYATIETSELSRKFKTKNSKTFPKSHAKSSNHISLNDISCQKYELYFVGFK